MYIVQGLAFVIVNQIQGRVTDITLSFIIYTTLEYLEVGIFGWGFGWFGWK